MSASEQRTKAGGCTLAEKVFSSSSLYCWIWASCSSRSCFMASTSFPSNSFCLPLSSSISRLSCRLRISRTSCVQSADAITTLLTSRSDHTHTHTQPARRGASGSPAAPEASGAGSLRPRAAASPSSSASSRSAAPTPAVSRRRVHFTPLGSRCGNYCTL